MKDEATTFVVIVLFWTMLGYIGLISGTYIAVYHPYLSAAFVVAWVSFYSMSGRKW